MNYNILDNIHRLKKYFKQSVEETEIPKAKLLTNNEALKAFGRLGLDHKSDILMMLAVIEYEFGRDNNYSDVETAALKTALAGVYKFFTACGGEWETFETQQAKVKVTPIKNDK